MPSFGLKVILKTRSKVIQVLFSLSNKEVRKG